MQLNIIELDEESNSMQLCRCRSSRLSNCLIHPDSLDDDSDASNQPLKRNRPAPSLCSPVVEVKDGIGCW